MADVIHKNFEHNALEADIQKLSKEIVDKKELPEHKDLSEKDIIKKILYPIIQQAVIQQPMADGQQSIRQLADQNQNLPDYLKDAPDDIKLQVEKLIDLAMHYGVEKAAKAASRLNAFVVDAFHDAIADRLYDELKNRKIL